VCDINRVTVLFKRAVVISEVCCCSGRFCQTRKDRYQRPTQKSFTKSNMWNVANLSKFTEIQKEESVMNSSYKVKPLVYSILWMGVAVSISM